MSVFSFVDEILEVKKDQSVTAFFTLKGDEEFLLDHFEGFPVMPGVLLMEALKQSAVKLLQASDPQASYRLAEVKEAKFGQFVKPGGCLRLSVRLAGRRAGAADFEARAELMQDGQPAGKALSALFTLDKI